MCFDFAYLTLEGASSFVLAGSASSRILAMRAVACALTNRTDEKKDLDQRIATVKSNMGQLEAKVIARFKHECTIRLNPNAHGNQMRRLATNARFGCVANAWYACVAGARDCKNGDVYAEGQGQGQECLRLA